MALFTSILVKFLMYTNLLSFFVASVFDQKNAIPLSVFATQMKRRWYT
jgi:hypothetical protein